MASSNRPMPLHRASSASGRRDTEGSTRPSWRRLLPTGDTLFALFAIVAALVVFADFAATF